MAAMLATEAEQNKAAERQTDGSKLITIEKQAWRPKVLNAYLDPDTKLDTRMGNLDRLFKEEGRVIIKNKRNLPPRNNIIEYDKTKHAQMLNDKMQWRDCPME